VLEWPAAEVADLLGTTTTAVNSGVRRARAQLAQALPAEDELAEPAEPDRRAVLDRFAAAIENADGSALAELLRADAALEMPPLLTWFTGRQTVARFIEAHFLTEPGGLRLVPVTANGERAFAVYRREPAGMYHAHAVLAVTVTATGIARIVAFQDTGLFGSFGLRQEYRAGSGPGWSADSWLFRAEQVGGAGPGGMKGGQDREQVGGGQGGGGQQDQRDGLHHLDGDHAKIGGEQPPRHLARGDAQRHPRRHPDQDDRGGLPANDRRDLTAYEAEDLQQAGLGPAAVHADQQQMDEGGRAEQ
jgi:hypothetical protein